MKNSKGRLEKVKYRSPRFVILFAAIALFAACSTFAFADELFVPSVDYPTIQSAIDAAVNGDIVIVADGIYTGDGNRDITFDGKAITVRSEYRAEGCIIDCGGSEIEPYRGFVFEDSEGRDSVLQGFTIVNGYADTHGGGINCYNGDPVIRGCIVIGNFAVSDGGGIACRYLSTPLIEDCIVAENYAGDDGGGIKCYYNSDVEITHCTIAGNEAMGTGGGIDSQYRCEVTVLNSIIWGNTPDELYGDISATYSNIMGGWEGAGNIGADPNFVNAEGWDYHLNWHSDCIDMGDQSYLGWLGTKDLDGEERLFGALVDMGADEVGPKQADFTRDGRIDVADFGVLSESWQTSIGEENWYVLSDLSGDFVVDANDLEALVEDWMWELIDY